MNRFLSLTTISLLLVAVSVLTTPSPALAAERGYHSQGTAQFVSPTGDFVGEGNASHLGNYTEIGNAAISPTGQVTAWAIYTDVHGNKLFASFAGQINQFGAITATVTYTGGTGRFTGASGSATLSGQVQLDGTLAIVVNGTLDD